MTAVKVETKRLADQLSAPTSVRRIVLADGTIIDHEFGGVSWIDVLRWERATTTT